MTMVRDRPDKRHRPRLPARPLTFRPQTDRPFRWLPRHGAPICVAEWMAQALVRLTAWLPFYIALVVTVILVVQVVWVK